MGAVGAFLKSRPGAIGLAPANPALPTAVGLPSVVGYGGRLRWVAYLGGTRRPPAKRECRPALRVPRRHSRAQGPFVHARHPSPPTRNAAGSGAGSKTSVRVRAPAAGPPPGGGDERRSTARAGFRHASTATERPATAHFFCWRPGRSVPTREAGPDVGATSRAMSQALVPCRHSSV